MDSVYKFFLLAAGLIITASLIFLGFRMAEAGKEAGNTSVNRFVDFNTELREAEIMQYDGTTVSGSDVVNFVRKNLSACSTAEEAPFEVIVKTGTVTTHRDNSSLADIVNFSHISYISPNGRFIGTVNRNANEVIVSVMFVQK